MDIVVDLSLCVRIYIWHVCMLVDWSVCQHVVHAVNIPVGGVVASRLSE